MERKFNTKAAALWSMDVDFCDSLSIGLGWFDYIP